MFDPYASVGTDETNASGWNDQPPAVAPPGSGNDTVLQIYVPADHTMIDCGAGNIPGIRMVSDRHAHITAAEPRTTISLGAAAGSGIIGNDGLNFYTGGHKTEVVEGETIETYCATKVETVTGAWKESCSSTKDEHVTGIWRQSCDNSYSMNVGTNAHYTYGSDVDIYAGGNHKQTISGRSESHYLSPSLDWHYGFKNSIFLGLDSSLNVANKFSIFVGLQESASLSASVSLSVGAALSVKVGGDLSLNASYSISRSIYPDSKTAFKRDNAGALVRDTGFASIEKSIVRLLKSKTVTVIV